MHTSRCVLDCRLQPWVHEICAVLGYYAAYSGIFLQTFRDNLSVPSSGVKDSIGQDPEDDSLWRIHSRPQKMGLIRCPEMSASIYQYTLCKNPADRKSRAVCMVHYFLLWNVKVFVRLNWKFKQSSTYIEKNRYKICLRVEMQRRCALRWPFSEVQYTFEQIQSSCWAFVVPFIEFTKRTAGWK
jgi:hypothetical protein